MRDTCRLKPSVSSYNQNKPQVRVVRNLVTFRRTRNSCFKVDKLDFEDAADFEMADPSSERWPLCAEEAKRIVKELKLVKINLLI